MREGEIIMTDDWEKEFDEEFKDRGASIGQGARVRLGTITLYEDIKSYFLKALEKQDEMHRTQIGAWHTSFGSSQLTHAIANVEADKKRLRLSEEEVTKTILDCQEQYLYIDEYYSALHVNILAQSDQFHYMNFRKGLE